MKKKMLLRSRANNNHYIDIKTNQCTIKSMERIIIVLFLHN